MIFILAGLVYYFQAVSVLLVIFFTDFIFPQISIFTNLSARAGYDTRSILSGVLQVWIQSFASPRLVASPKLKNPLSPYYLPLPGGRIIIFIPFPVLCEIQSVSSRIWTSVAVSISYDNNHYTTGPSNFPQIVCEKKNYLQIASLYFFYRPLEILK